MGALFCASAGLVTPSALASDAAPPSRAAVPPHGCAPTLERRLLATGAALIPGIIVHGAGHYVLCETTTAQRLLLLEGIGAGSAVGSALGLALTGASRYVVAPLALGAIAGVGTFGLTLLADIYGVAAPEGGTGTPGPRPRLLVQSGVRGLYDRHFDGSWLSSTAFRVDLGPVWFAPRMDAALDAPVYRYSVSGARRLIGGRGAASANVLDAGLALSDHAYSADGFATTTLDVFIAGRLHLEVIGPTLRGAFVDAGAGYARQWTRFDGLPGDATDELLARFAFGMYLGSFPGVAGETWLAYDHRRDTFAGGLLLPGIGAGYAGHLEQRTELFFGRTFGAAAEIGYGSALVGSAYLLVRLGTEDD